MSDLIFEKCCVDCNGNRLVEIQFQRVLTYCCYHCSDCGTKSLSSRCPELALRSELALLPPADEVHTLRPMENAKEYWSFDRSLAEIEEEPVWNPF